MEKLDFTWYRKVVAETLSYVSVLCLIVGIAGFANNISMALADETLSCEGLTQQLGIGEEEMGSWNETINYLGYSNKHQAVGYILLRRLAEIAK